MVWGGEDFVSLAKELVALHKKPEYEKFTAKGGVMEGEKLTAGKSHRGQQVAEPRGPDQHRTGTDSLARLASCFRQINAPGGKLLSQIKKKSEGEEAAAQLKPNFRFQISDLIEVSKS